MYLTSSIREATSMSKAQLVAELKPYILFGLQGASKDQLVSMWLERFGTREPEPERVAQLGRVLAEAEANGYVIMFDRHPEARELDDTEINRQMTEVYKSIDRKSV